MPHDFPAKQHIFDPGALPDVVFDHVTPAGALAVNDNPNMRHIATKVVSYKISGSVVLRSRAGRQGLTFASEKYHQIRNAAVIDIRVGLTGNPSPFSWIGG